MHAPIPGPAARSMPSALRRRAPAALRARGSSEALLAALAIFRGAGAASLARIARGALAISVSKGESVFARGERCTGFYAIADGAIKLAFHSPVGTEKVVEILRAGKSFGEATMFADHPWLITAQALADSTLLHVSRQLLTEEMAREPALSSSVLAGLSRRLHALLGDLGADSTRSGAERLTAYLLRGAHRDASESVSVDVALPPKGDVASRLSMTPEHFSRILHRMEALGLLEVHGRLVHVPDAGRLSAYATGEAT